MWIIILTQFQKNLIMNKEQLLGLARHILTILGGYYIAKGTLDADQLEQVVGGLVSLIGFGWSYWVKK